MEIDKFKTKAQFLKNIMLSDNDKIVIYAFFPEESYSDDRWLFNSYSHIGQHSPCHIDYAKASTKATFKEYKDLAEELESIGYNLEII